MIYHGRKDQEEMRINTADSYKNKLKEQVKDLEQQYEELKAKYEELTKDLKEEN